jgi:NRAMP (natural resistance-associated macrophage protein)-like metal ion transporter
VFFHFNIFALINLDGNRQEYNSKKWVSLWIMSEISIVASDVQAVITSAIAFRILFNFPLWFGCIITAVDAITFLSLHLLGIRSLESFFVAIVAVMSICFFWTFSLRPPDPVEVLQGSLIPSIPSYGLATAVGIVGSLILPQNYYVHSAIVLTREVDRNNPVQVREANKYMLADAAVALFIAFLLNFCVISSFAELFFDKGSSLSFTYCFYDLAYLGV